MVEGYKTLTPVRFARAIQSAQGYRCRGESQIISAHRALDDCGLSRDWTVILIATLDSSPSIAEAWAERRIEEQFTNFDERS